MNKSWMAKFRNHEGSKWVKLVLLEIDLIHLCLISLRKTYIALSYAKHLINIILFKPHNNPMNDQGTERLRFYNEHKSTSDSEHL